MLPSLRETVSQVRKAGYEIDVRVTWEKGDAALLAREAAEQGINRVVAGGGDGTLHEVMNGLMELQKDDRPAMGILPLGTANDFARSCQVPLELFPALELAVSGNAEFIDVVQMNDSYFLNMITSGFGAEVTVSTPPELKKMLGGAAYSLMGFLMAFNFKPYNGWIKIPELSQPISAVVGAVGNGCQAGGGKVLTPQAKINDGLMDIMILHEFTVKDLPQLAEEVKNLSENGKFISYYQTSWVEFSNDTPMPVNLDGEPFQVNQARLDVIPQALPVVLPRDCPLLVNL